MGNISSLVDDQKYGNGERYCPKYRCFDIIDFEELKNDGKSNHENENYGFLPENCIHQILLFLEPPDLFNSFLSCKIVYLVSSNRLWWKSYYRIFFHDLEEENYENYTHRNWKGMFHKKFRTKQDLNYRKRFKVLDRPIDTFDRMMSSPIDMVSFGRNGKTKNYACDRFSKAFMEELSSYYYPSNGSDDVDYQTQLKFYRSEILIEVLLSPEQISSGVGNLEVIKFYSPISPSPVDMKKMEGLFLCFYIDDKSTFESLKRDFEEKRLKEWNQSTILLIGMVKKVSLGKDRFVRLREVEFSEALEYTKKKRFLGYVECDDTKENTNVFVAVGMLLEDVLKDR